MTENGWFPFALIPIGRIDLRALNDINDGVEWKLMVRQTTIISKIYWRFLNFVDLIALWMTSWSLAVKWSALSELYGSLQCCATPHRIYNNSIARLVRKCWNGPYTCLTYLVKLRLSHNIDALDIRTYWLVTSRWRPQIHCSRCAVLSRPHNHLYSQHLQIQTMRCRTQQVR